MSKFKALSVVSYRLVLGPSPPNVDMLNLKLYL